jgi:energy-converting hydrogenase Eha subunit A
MKFRRLPLPGRIIIFAVAGGVFVVAGVAVATSYNAIYRLVGSLDLYGDGITKTFGMMLDVAFIAAELAAILAGILKAVHLGRLPVGVDEDTIRDEARKVSKGWPGMAMLACGVATMAFNVVHAFLIGGAHDPLTIWRCIVAAFPPVLMILSFQVLIAIVKWTMLTLGRPLNSATVLSPATVAYGQAPAMAPSYSAGAAPQTGQTDLQLGSAVPKVEFARQVCRTKSPKELAKTEGPNLVGELQALGVGIAESEAWRAISEVKAERNGHRG